MGSAKIVENPKVTSETKMPLNVTSQKFISQSKPIQYIGKNTSIDKVDK